MSRLGNIEGHGVLAERRPGFVDYFSKASREVQ